MILGIVETISGWFKPISDWVSEHNDSWFFWVGLLLVFLFLFGVVLEALTKNNR